jgi:sialidase-1
MPTSKRLGAPLILMFALFIAMTALAVPANAAPYTTAPSTSVSNQTPTAGSSLTFCGSDFEAGETVTITLDNGTTYPSAVADASGAFCTTIVLGASLSGTHTLTATGTTSGRTSSTQIQVLGVSTNAGPTTNGGTTTNGGLAFTGTTAVGIGALGTLLLLGGTAILLASRRRKASA